MASSSSSPRDYDIVIWGATGFTGKFVTAALAGNQAPFLSCTLPNSDGSVRGGLRYAIAGRNRAKLEQVASSCGCGPDVDILVADATDREAIAAFVCRTRCVVAAAGPFKRYSDVIVGECAAAGTHWVDTTGEAAWVRSVTDRYDDLARSTGAVICSMCGFDSIPFDLGTLVSTSNGERGGGEGGRERSMRGSQR
jgi:short subunit dehydrogenase-like uncharacterized protein